MKQSLELSLHSIVNDIDVVNSEIQLPESLNNKARTIVSPATANTKKIRKEYTNLKQQVQSCSRNQLMMELCEELEAQINNKINNDQCDKFTTQEFITNYHLAKTAAYFNMHKKSKGMQ